MHYSLVPKGVIASPFIQKDIRDAIKIACHNGVNIAIQEMPQNAEKCLAIRMLVRRVNIEYLEHAFVVFQFHCEDTAVRLSIMTDDFN